MFDRPIGRFGECSKNAGFSCTTALVALTLVDALRLCDRLNRRLGLDHEAWTKLVGQSMAAARDGAPLH